MRVPFPSFFLGLNERVRPNPRCAINQLLACVESRTISDPMAHLI